MRACTQACAHLIGSDSPKGRHWSVGMFLPAAPTLYSVPGNPALWLRRAHWEKAAGTSKLAHRGFSQKLT